MPSQVDLEQLSEITAETVLKERGMLEEGSGGRGAGGFIEWGAKE